MYKYRSMLGPFHHSSLYGRACWYWSRYHGTGAFKQYLGCRVSGAFATWRAKLFARIYTKVSAFPMIIWCNMQSKPIHLSRSENNNIHVHILKHICIKIKVSHFKFNFFSVNGFKSEQCGTADFLKNCNIYHMSSKQLVIVCNYILHSSSQNHEMLFMLIIN